MSFSSWTLNLLLLAAVPGQAEPHAINRRDFKIPIVIPAEERARLKELILFVSSDEGKTWQQTANATPEMDHFRFFAQGDGLYWFTVVVVDQQGKRQPEDVYRVPPSQKILVDSIRPAVQIIVASRDGEEVLVSWDIRDDSLDPSSIRLEYRPFEAPEATLWQTVPAPAKASGDARFRPNYTGPLKVRVVAKDRAGNSGSMEKDVPPATPSTVNATPLSGAPHMRTSASPPAPTEADSPIASGHFPPPPAPNPPYPNHGQPTPPYPNNGAQFPTPPYPNHGGHPAPPYPNNGLQPNPPYSNNGGQLNPPYSNNGGHAAPPYANNGGPIPTPPYPPAPPYPSAPPYPPSGGQHPHYSPGGFPAVNPGGHDEQRVVAVSPGATMPAENAVVAPTASTMLQPPRIVNSTQIALEYEVKCGPSGVGKVELWLSTDDGRNWRAYSDDPTPGSSPLEATLPGEGIFGLKLVVHSGNGLSKGPPLPGDPPDVRIEVDAKPPLVQMYEPKPDPHRRDTLTISWSASDRNLAPRPVTLEWAERSEGPWRLIATDLPSTGAHAWQLTPEVPARVLLRATALDNAGNRGIAETRNPVLTDLNKPEGRILNIAPVSRPLMGRP